MSPITAVLLACIAINLSSQPNQRSGNGEQAIEQQKPSRPPTLIQNCQSTAPADRPQTKPPEGNAAPEWALVIVGVITFIVIGWQAVATKKAAEATQESAKAARDSIKLQEISLSQWVVADNWQAGYPRISCGGVGYVHVTFEIVNQTKFPLTLQSVKAKILDSESEIGISKPHFLPPDGKYRFGIHVGIKDAKASSFGAIEFSPFLEIINVFVEYDDVLKKRQTQELGAAVEMQSAVKSTFMPLMIDITPKTKP